MIWSIKNSKKHSFHQVPLFLRLVQMSRLMCVSVDKKICTMCTDTFPGNEERRN
jgi:hypothetical protein